MASSQDWSSLPEHVVVKIFTCLTLGDRYNAALTCRDWLHCFSLPYLWRHFDYYFYTKSQERLVKSVQLYGQSMKSVYIELDQGEAENRDNACKVLTGLAKLPHRRLQRIRIKCTGENPLFYVGQEFKEALTDLFGQVANGQGLSNQLLEVDLSGLPVAYDDSVFDVLSQNHPNLERLNILNSILVCKVTPQCVLRLVTRCRKLKEIQVFYSSMSEDILEAFTEGNRIPLQHLSMKCRREEKYGRDLSDDMWKRVVQALPDLHVTLAFDNTCPLHKVSQIMNPQIPVSVLRLETFTRIYEEVNLATDFYHDSLEKLVLQTRPSAELNKALLRLSSCCPKLRALHVFCVLDRACIEKIHADHPILKEKGSYTLKDTMEPHPWISGRDC
ncbi:F-box/LRR-repeat protein 8 [Lingula anatina]|uniref:F-box/LRR-repeat protein 8 n=1 Tax=Lingula anatina TaxID=7574 RepID=A0A1S3HEW2_LINAN|nr:F-box/LRR-repeat protein 8 [Lingula anatina]XP_013383569.1 F-box/LRR-repeat protein 8 [Lingula anatina]XP_013383570.1 F-box/LRR-repeat protein 8 [Lingula anatina]|eukprot:XP_013383568.1 F-box/LRR-repeat protein 8 [Lingula anatina]